MGYINGVSSTFANPCQPHLQQRDQGFAVKNKTPYSVATHVYYMYTYTIVEYVIRAVTVAVALSDLYSMYIHSV